MQVGSSLGSYQVLGLLGRGGMGEVYRARDTKLGREVAIKLVADEVVADEQSLERLNREARALAALNHPNIAAIYSLDEAAGVRFLVLELVEGQPLSHLLGKGPLPPRDALHVCHQIAEALEAAHEKQIVHRDLKPSNVMITPTGRVKVLDFGIAKRVQPGPLADLKDQSAMTTATKPAARAGLTIPGSLVGTIPYMSPEQVRGKPVDNRSDIWAFGCVMYETLAGQNPFARENQADTVSAILEREPQWTAIPAETPAAAQMLLRRCLRKEPHLRLRDIGDARLEIAETLEQAASLAATTLGPQTAPGTRGLIRVLLTSLAVVLAIALGVWWLVSDRQPAPSSRAVVSVVPPPGTHLQWGIVSPDGEKLVLVAADPEGPTHLWVRAFDSPTPRKLADTAGATYPFWSPDSRSLGFFADGRLKRVGAGGGAVETLGEAGGRGGSWGRDGTIVFASSGASGLFTIPAAGGTPTPLTTLNRSQGENSHRWPSFLPDGRNVLYFVRNSVDPSLTGVYVVSLDTKESRQLVRANSLAVYAPPRYLLYRRGENLVAHPFDSRTLQLTGEPVTIADEVWYDPSFTGLANFNVSEEDRLAYRSGGIERTELVWFDRNGTVLGRVGEPGNYLNLYLSPDDRQVAVSLTDERTENRELFVYNVTSNRVRQLTFEAASDFSPVWSPDGRSIIFSSDRKGDFDLYEMDASGSSEARLLLKSDTTKLVTDWSSDGGLVAYSSYDAGSRDVWALRVDGLETVRLRHTEAAESFAVISPDNRWLAYCSNELGQFEVFVERLGVGGGRWKISSGGGFQPVWHPKGKELFYLDPHGNLMAVEIVQSLDTFEASSPRVLFPTRVNVATVNPPDSLNHYDVSADGQRFLIASQPEAASVPVVVVFNWNARLKG